MPISKTYLGSAFVQGSGSGTISLPSYNQAAGECIVVFTETYEGGGNIVNSITDTAGNTYVRLISGQGFTSGNSTYLNAWVAKNCLGNASNVIQANYSGPINFSTVAAYRCSGADLSSPIDIVDTSSGSSASAASASYTTSTADEALLALMGTQFGYLKADSVDSGFTLDAGEVGGSGQGLSATASNLVTSIQTSQVVTFTLHASNAWNVLLISVKEAGAVGSSRRPIVCVME